MAIDPARPLLQQVALVTGGNSGIGEACAPAPGVAGARVVVNYFFDRNEAKRVVEKISENGSDAIAIQADMSQEGAVQAMFREANEHFGTIDILINNAGLQQDSPFQETSLEKWQRVILSPGFATGGQRIFCQ